MCQLQLKLVVDKGHAVENVYMGKLSHLLAGSHYNNEFRCVTIHPVFNLRISWRGIPPPQSFQFPQVLLNLFIKKRHLSDECHSVYLEQSWHCKSLELNKYTVYTNINVFFSLSLI